MPVNTPRWITVDPDGHTLSVTITKGGDAVHAYARDGGGNDGELRASPMTVAAPTTFWFRASGQYEVSMLLDGHEVASDSGARTVALSTGGKAVKPSADALRKAVASELPTPTADDAGKALVVNEAGDAFELGEAAGTSLASVMALIATVNGYNLFAVMVTVEAGTVPSYEGSPPGDQGWFLYAADTPLSEAGLSGSAAYNSDEAHPAGTFIAEFYADAANPAPTALPDGWTPASPLIALAALEARVAALETP